MASNAFHFRQFRIREVLFGIGLILPFPAYSMDPHWMQPPGSNTTDPTFDSKGDQSDSPSHPDWRDSLLKRVETDQEARQKLIDWYKLHSPDATFRLDSLSEQDQKSFQEIVNLLSKIDADNTQWLERFISEHGWPRFVDVGKDGGQAAWLLVQHADARPEFQRRCLDLMTSLPKDQVSQQNLAYLTDRVLLAEGKKQRFGTQFEIKDGTWQPRPIEDPEHVDELRKEAGLNSLAEYGQMIAEQYSSSKK